MTKPAVTHERLVALLAYNPETGEFIRRVSAGASRAGSVAGALRSDGYAQIAVDGRMYQAHRLAWFCVHGEWPKQHIDHINHKKADNRITNLRDVSIEMNAQNRAAATVRNKAGLLGVSMHKSGLWRSRIMAAGLSRVSYFHTSQEAHAHYMAVKAVLHPSANLTP